MQVHWRVEFLGGLRVEQRGRVVSRFRTQKTGALLAYLAYYRHRSHRREELVELLWPESDRAAGRNSLNTALSWLRRHLDPPSPAGEESVIAVDRASIGLSEAAVTTDVAEFEAALRSAAGAASSRERADWLAQAVALYAGELLPGHFEDWVLQERQWLAERYFQTLRQLLTHLEREGDFRRALEYAHRGVSADPLREEAHGELMRLYAAAGQPAAALRQYQELERLLMAQLGSTPEPAIRALAQDIERLNVARPSGIQVFGHSGVQADKVKDESAFVDPEHLNAQDHRQQQPAVPPEYLTPEGENRLATVLFIGLSRPTKRPGGRSWERAETLSHRFLQSMVDALIRYEGRIDHFLDEGALAVFGAPIAHEDDAERAIRAALDIRQAAQQLGLEVTAGIESGELSVSSTGAARDQVREALVIHGGPVKRQVLGVAGVAVDRGGRLRESAQSGQILVGEATYRLTRRAFEFAPCHTSCAGIPQPAAVHAVERALPHPEKARGIEGLRADLVGRDDELARLRQVVARVLQGTGQIVSLIGEAGVGKSRLVAELKRAVKGDESEPPRGDGLPSSLITRHSSLQWLEGRCFELGMTTGYSVFVDLLRHFFAITRAAEEHERQGSGIVGRLTELVGQGDLSAERADEIGPLLGNLLSLSFGDGRVQGRESRDPEQVRGQTLLAMRDFILAVARQQPAVLVLEDLHWADTLSIDLISLLMESLSTAPLLLLCLYRPERDHKCARLGAVAAQKCAERHTELRLRELTPTQSRHLIESLLGIEKVPSSVKELILKKTGGNPYFLEEVVRSGIEAGAIYRDGNAWSGREDWEELTAPQSIQSVILSRVDRLEPELKHVLQTASVIGRLFRPRLLEQIVNRSGRPQPEHLNLWLWELEQRGLIYQEQVVPEEEYSFKHVLTQETIYQGLLPDRRSPLHRQVAEAIETLAGNGLDEYLEQLAHHHEQSGPDALSQERSLSYWIRAAERAHRAAGYQEEATLLTRAIGIAERLGHRDLPELRGKRGTAYARVAMWPDARPDLEAALAGPAAERDEQRIRWLVDLAIVSHWVLDVPGMRRYATEALALAEATGRDDLAAGAMGALALADASDGNLAASLGQFQRAVVRAGEIRTVPLPAAIHMSALVLYFLGRYPEAAERAREMIEVGRAVNDTSTTALAMGHLGLALMGSGRYVEAMQNLEEMRLFAQEYGVGRGLARSLGLRAGLHLELCDFSSSEALAEEAREVARRLNWGHPVISCGIDLLLCFARSQQAGRAEKLADEVAESVRAGAGNHGWLWRLRFAQAQAEIALARGDWAGALDGADHAIALGRATGRVKYQVDGLGARAKALAGLSRTHEAIAALHEATAMARLVGDPALFLRAATALLGIDGDDALAAEAGMAARQMSAALPEGEMRRRFEASEPWRLLRGGAR